MESTPTGCFPAATRLWSRYAIFVLIVLIVLF
jgi:hypothetical protein